MFDLVRIAVASAAMVQLGVPAIAAVGWLLFARTGMSPGIVSAEVAKLGDIALVVIRATNGC
jgi:hypothetical protein